MKKKIIITLSALVAITLFCSSCSGDCLNMKMKEVKKLLHSRLAIGDNREKVEEVLKSISLKGNVEFSFSYDRYVNRYQSTIRDEKQCGPHQGISIYLNVDNSGKLSEIDVHKFYTMP